MNQKLLPLAILLGLLPGLLPGYGPEAHRVIATIAEDNLTTPVRDEIGRMLGGQTLASISTWADRYRRDHRETSSWHYIDREIASGKILEGSDAGGTILDAISSQSAILASGAPIEDRRKALMFLVHFIGDLHQPNHAADNYDMGGNEVMTTGTGRELKLHAVWDSEIAERILRDEKTSAEALATKLAEKYQPERDLLSTGTVEDWAMDSFEIGKRVVYSYDKPSEPGGVVVLNDAYLTKARATVERQMAVAGFRLARLLNEIVGGRAVAAAKGNAVLQSGEATTTGAAGRRGSAGTVLAP